LPENTVVIERPFVCLLVCSFVRLFMYHNCISQRKTTKSSGLCTISESLNILNNLFKDRLNYGLFHPNIHEHPGSTNLS